MRGFPYFILITPRFAFFVWFTTFLFCRGLNGAFPLTPDAHWEVAQQSFLGKQPNVFGWFPKNSIKYLLSRSRGIFFPHPMTPFTFDSPNQSLSETNKILGTPNSGADNPSSPNENWWHDLTPKSNLDCHHPYCYSTNWIRFLSILFDGFVFREKKVKISNIYRPRKGRNDFRPR